MSMVSCPLGAGASSWPSVHRQRSRSALPGTPFAVSSSGNGPIGLGRATNATTKGRTATTTHGTTTHVTNATKNAVIKPMAHGHGFGRGTRFMPGMTNKARGTHVARGLLNTGFEITGPLSYLEALGVLAGVVGVHELGHFSAAALQNIYVKKFAIGFGPVLWGYKDERDPNSVEFSFRAIPLGGYVAFPDDDEDCPYEKDDPNLLTNRPVKDRIIVTCAGVAANMVAALAICIVQVGVVGFTEPTYFPGIVIGTINPGTVAEKAGLQKGDIVTRIGNLEIEADPSSVQRFVDLVKVSPKKQLEMEVLRSAPPTSSSSPASSSKLSLTIAPAEMPDGTGRIGVSLAPNVELNNVKADGFVKQVELGGREFGFLLSNVCRGLFQFVTNFAESSKNVSGPVAILAAGSEVARNDANGLYQFAALINLNLAVVNILPLPALDGGYLVFQMIEVVQGKKVDRDSERAIMTGGFLLLSSLGMYLIFRDAIKLLF